MVEWFWVHGCFFDAPPVLFFLVKEVFSRRSTGGGFVIPTVCGARTQIAERRFAARRLAPPNFRFAEMFRDPRGQKNEPVSISVEQLRGLPIKSKLLG